MRQQWTAYLLALGLALGAASSAMGQGPGFTTIHFPDASSTQTWGVNPCGAIVGFYSGYGITRGFLLSGGRFTTFDFPGASSISRTDQSSRRHRGRVHSSRCVPRISPERGYFHYDRPPGRYGC